MSILKYKMVCHKTDIMSLKIILILFKNLLLSEKINQSN